MLVKGKRKRIQTNNGTTETIDSDFVYGEI